MTLMQVERVDQAAVLRTLNLNPSDPHTQALLLICQRYGLDPLLKHVVLIQGRPYVTRDGYLAIAHQSGQFDGIEIVEEGETPSYWWAKAAVYRKDMGRPFSYRGRYPKQGAGNAKFGPEMAVKTAEVMALRRAFNVTGVSAADEAWTDDHDNTDIPATMTSAEAKSRLLSLVGGDKEAAIAAWDKAGLTDVRELTETEFEAVVAELHQLAWTWAPHGPDGNNDSGPTEPKPIDTVGAGPEAPAAVDNPEDAAAGREGAVEPGRPPSRVPAPSTRVLAMKAGHVFRDDYENAPSRQKTRTLDRLRHALVYACTGGKHTSLKSLTPAQLAVISTRLEDINAGRLTYKYELDDTKGVTFTTQTGAETYVPWIVLESEAEPEPGDAA